MTDERYKNASEYERILCEYWECPDCYFDDARYTDQVLIRGKFK